MYVFYATVINAFIDIEILKGNKLFNISTFKSNNYSIRIEINSSLSKYGNNFKSYILILLLYN